MNDQKIIPEKITRPFQLLAAWLLGLIILDGAFLYAAQKIKQPEWIPIILVFAAILNVPIFLFCLFKLQTKYRPEMQEDSFYSKYLEYQHSSKSIPIQPLNIKNQINKVSKDIIKQLGPINKANKNSLVRILHSSQVQQISARVGSSRSLSELFLRPKVWPEIVYNWKNEKGFEEDVSEVVAEGLVTIRNRDFKSCKLTELGIKVAEFTKEKEKLWAQINKQWWDYSIKPSRSKKNV